MKPEILKILIKLEHSNISSQDIPIPKHIDAYLQAFQTLKKLETLKREWKIKNARGLQSWAIYNDPAKARLDDLEYMAHLKTEADKLLDQGRKLEAEWNKNNKPFDNLPFIAYNQ